MPAIWSRAKTAGALIRALLAAFLVCPGPVAAPAAGVHVGEDFPDLTRLGLEGKLPDWKGKVVLIDLWASWCGPCRQSFPAMNELQRQFSARGFLVLGVSVDEQRNNMEKFLGKTPAEFSIVRDARQALASTVDMESIPTSYLLDQSGKVRFVHKGYQGDRTKQQYIREIEGLLGKSGTQP